MKLIVELDLDNAAFDADDEITRILHRLGDTLDGISLGVKYQGTLLDVNGNTVGAWSIA